MAFSSLSGWIFAGVLYKQIASVAAAAGRYPGRKTSSGRCEGKTFQKIQLAKENLNQGSGVAIQHGRR